jgi:N-acetylglutamate synthase-like GNAT family acetyltransferase
VFATIGTDVFPGLARQIGDRLPSDWWRVEDGGRVVAYGWLDDVWGNAEILLAVDEPARGAGAGAFALARLEDEAAARGLNYVVNVVRDTHPEREAVTGWFLAHGFSGTDDGRLGKQVGDRARDIGQHQSGRPGTGRAEPPDDGRRARYDAARDRAAARPRVETPVGADMGPGHEESGGYVDVDDHRF